MATEEAKRRVATKKNIEEYRAQYRGLTDERLIALIEELFPNRYDERETIVAEIVKELYRDNKELSEEEFKTLLSTLANNNKLLKYDRVAKEREAKYNRVRSLLSQILEDASKGADTYLSHYSGYEEIIEYLKEHYKDPDGTETVAQKLRTEFDYMHVPFNFHVYSEPNGDVVLTKKKRTQQDYVAHKATSGASGASSSGCMGVILFFVLLAVLATAL